MKIMIKTIFAWYNSVSKDFLTPSYPYTLRVFVCAICTVGPNLLRPIPLVLPHCGKKIDTKIVGVPPNNFSLQ
jgi:hypothetical protein